LLFLPLVAWIAQQAGWRVALAPGIGFCAVAALLFWLFARNHPSELGLAPYGDTVVAPPPPVTGNAVGNAFAALAEAARTRVFWILFITFAVCGLSTNGLVQTHFVPLCADFGVGEVQAASMLALIGAFDFVGTIISGWLSDRYDNRILLFWYYGLRGLSLLALPFTDFTLIGLSVFAVFYGLDWVATVPPTVRLAAQAFGREKAPLVFGWIFTAHQLGGAVAALGAGMSRDALASYLPAFALAGFACLVAAVLALGARKPAPAVAA
jgi:predicted MFS family arabinose efflux permease